MNRFEKRRKAIDQAIREQIDEYKAIYKRSEDENRDLDTEERLDVESHLKSIETLKTEKESVEANIKTLEHVDDIGRQLGPSSVSVVSEPHDRMFDQINRAMPMNKSIGEQFTDSAGYKSAIQTYREHGKFTSGFTTGQITFDTKGTLLEGAGAPGAGTGGGLIAVPQLIPGVVETLFQRLTFADLLLSGQTTTNTLRYVVEGTATSGATGVTEANTKPESTLGLSTTDEPVKKIATLLPIAEEMLEDAPAVQAYINGRLVLFIQIEEERQLIRGTASGPQVQGLLSGRSVPVYAGGTAAGDRSVQLFKAMNGMRGSAYVEPEWIVMNPTDYQAIRLLTDTNGQYFGGGPFLGTYGNAGPVGASGQVTGATDEIWGKPCYVTGQIGAGTAIVGSRANAQVFRRGGVSVEATNSHSTYFALNLIAIRAEERLALALYRPTGYVEVRLS